MKSFLSRTFWVTFLMAGFSLLFVAPANAYLDPGSGSIIFQVVVGGAMAIGLGVKIFWRRIVSLFNRKR